MNKISLDGIYSRLSRNGECFYGLRNTQHAIELYDVDMNPDFQRGVVWTLEQQENFVGHMLEGGDTSAIILNERGTSLRFEVVDGLQRLTACLKWSKDEIGGRLSDGRLIWLNQLDDVSSRTVGMAVGLRYALCKLTRAEVLAYYIKVNRGGTVHTTEEINKVKALLEQETK